MDNPLTSGRLIGAILLTQFVGGVLVNFYLTGPMNAEPGFVVNGALYETQIGLAALIGMFISGLTIVSAIIAYPVFSAKCMLFALSFLAMATAGLVTATFEQVSLLNMVSYSQAAINDPAAFENFASIVKSQRYWAHYANLSVSGVTTLIFFFTLFRFKLIPRAIAGFAILSSLLQLFTVTQPFLGGTVMFELLAPIALAYILVASALLWRGLQVDGEK